MANKFLGQITSKKPFERIFALGKITQILKSYESIELNQMHKKLIRGFYTTKFNQNAYLTRNTKLKPSAYIMNDRRKGMAL